MKFSHVALAAVLVGSVGSMAAHAQAFSDDDKTFLKDITQGNMGEIKLSELAVKTTKDPKIKSFAQKMVTDHNTLLAGVMPVDAKAGVSLPKTDGMDADANYLKLKVLTGKEFDKSYVKTMVSDHHATLDKIKQEHDTTANPELKTMTAHAVTVVEGHTKMVDTLAGSMGLQ